MSCFVQKVCSVFRKAVNDQLNRRNQRKRDAITQFTKTVELIGLNHQEFTLFHDNHKRAFSFTLVTLECLAPVRKFAFPRVDVVTKITFICRIRWHSWASIARTWILLMMMKKRVRPCRRRSLARRNARKRLWCALLVLIWLRAPWPLSHLSRNSRSHANKSTGWSVSRELVRKRVFSEWNSWCYSWQFVVLHCAFFCLILFVINCFRVWRRLSWRAPRSAFQSFRKVGQASLERSWGK